MAVRFGHVGVHSWNVGKFVCRLKADSPNPDLWNSDLIVNMCVDRECQSCVNWLHAPANHLFCITSRPWMANDWRSCGDTFSPLEGGDRCFERWLSFQKCEQSVAPMSPGMFAITLNSCVTSPCHRDSGCPLASDTTPLSNAGTMANVWPVTIGMRPTVTSVWLKRFCFQFEKMITVNFCPNYKSTI